jgi:hypothetical protein
MMDTQETNLPKEEKAFTEEGKVEEPQTPDINPEATAIAPDEKVEEVITQTDISVETTVTEVNKPVETPPPTSSEVTLEEAAVEVTETKEDAPPAETETDANVEEPIVEIDAKVEEDPVVEKLDEQETASTDQPGENASDEETTPAPEAQEEKAAPLEFTTKQEVIERLTLVVADPETYARNEADVLKQTYYKLRRTEVDAARKAFLETGGEEHDFVMPEDKTEIQLKALIASYKEKRASIAANEERQKESNYLLKQHLIDRLKALTESQDDFNKRYNEFREIQRKWKEIKLVPKEHAKDLWRNYHLYNERFYDIVKINNQFRDYDFKKNLELKTALCEAVERLDKEPDVISAFHQLQKFHQQWRETGPVAKDFRNTIWERFKEASTVINKKYQAHIEVLRINETKNLKEKIAICKQIESIDFEALKTLNDWEKKTQEVIRLKAKWGTIGHVARKQNTIKLLERFRTVCNAFFHKKNAFYQLVLPEMDKNLELKKALIEKAVSMKERTDWKEATKDFIALQNEWKKIGPVTQKYSDTLWKQFIAICNYFFEQKNREVSSQISEENDNLKAKKDVIEKICTMDENLTDEEALSTLRGYMSDWGNIGFVPFKEKEKLHKSFHEAVNKQFDRLKVNERDRRVQQFRSNLTELADTGKNKLYNERDRLMRVYERMRNELQTYENNMGFFNVSSKRGDGLLKEMDRKLDRLKEEMEVIVKKIEAIDENLK